MNNQKRWLSLDILRGIAVVFMLINHAAVKWLIDVDAGISGTLNFAGSFAPVLFFFVTGLGYGLAHEVGRPAKTKDVLVKAFLLISADVFMRGGDFTQAGWNFLAFIAFSMILLHGLRGRKYGLLGAFVLIVVLLFVRFGLGAFYDKTIALEDQVYWLSAIFGIAAFDGVAYWFTPWFVYPLLGFILGVFGRKYSDRITRHIGKISLFFAILGITISLLSYVLWIKGYILFRWGTVSINFFVASVACLLLCLALSWFVADKLKNTRMTKLLSMQGVSSLAVVPIHYLFIKLLGFSLDEKISETVYLIAMPFWVAVCFTSARLTNQLTIVLTKKNSPALMYSLISTTLVFAIITTVLPAYSWMFIITFTAQYILCILLGFSYVKR